jgi:hypothetical protein
MFSRLQLIFRNKMSNINTALATYLRINNFPPSAVLALYKCTEAFAFANSQFVFRSC